MLYAFARPLLFALDPETAHDLTLAALRAAPVAAVRCAAPVPPAQTVEVMGLRFPSRVGLAAGLDKNGACIDGLAALGFGFIEIGTVTPRPQPGNPRPRMFRLPEREALINRMGFNNDGVDKLVANVRAARFGPASGGILGINIGKNFDTPIERAADDYVRCLERVYPHASYVTVNISSPNTANLRALQEREGLAGLLGAVNAARERLCDRHGRRVPLAVKIAPDLAPEQLDAIADELRRQRADAVIATNTTVSREGVEGLAEAEQAGGLSGAPLFARATSIIEELARRLAGELPIIGVGGIMTGAQAKAKLDAGAALVQLYTGLVYRGPALVREAIAATRT